MNSETISPSFQFDFKQLIVLPGKSATTTITFIPKECKPYSDKLIFELNGLTRREITLSGLGTQMKIELADPKQKLFDLGTIQIGKVVRKTLQVVNRSLAPVDFSLLFEPKNEVLAKDKSVLQILPAETSVSLKPNQVLDLQFKFTSKVRIAKFVEDLNVECFGITTPLCSIQGACHGYNIWLESSTLPFGAIAQKCSTTKRILLHNDGDIGASFKWDLEKFKPEFSIYPTIGYISPGMEVNCDVTFNPTELSADIRKENIKCFVEGI
jgi:hydrocephalus-inducing protein